MSVIKYKSKKLNLRPVKKGLHAVSVRFYRCSPKTTQKKEKKRSSCSFCKIFLVISKKKVTIYCNLSSDLKKYQTII